MFSPQRPHFIVSKAFSLSRAHQDLGNDFSLVLCRQVYVLVRFHHHGVRVLGVVFGPKDKGRGRMFMIREGLRDLSPGVVESVLNLLESWKGSESEKDLAALIGEERAKRILRITRESSSR